MPHKCPVARAKWFERNKVAQLARIKAWKAANPEAVRRTNAAAAKRVREDRPEEYLLRSRRDEATRTPEKRAAKWNSWAERNGEKILAYRVSHRAEHAARQRPRNARLGKPPAWADLDAIKAVYRESERLTKKTGITHHVDHIIPLKGKTVSGLHVHYNLQPIPAADNRRKSNRLLEA